MKDLLPGRLFTHRKGKSLYVVIVLFCMFSSDWLFAQNLLPADTTSIQVAGVKPVRKEKPFKMTSLTFGGNGVSFTNINSQFSVFTGGRGSATFNNRITLGGGGWGMPKGVEVESDEEGVYSFARMGYGGIELGYIFYPGKWVNIGTNVLFAGGAVFKETVPESKNNSFNMFPVLEPSLYFQFKFSKLFHFEFGTTYRSVFGTDLPYITNSQLSGFSCYVGFLVSACACK